MNKRFWKKLKKPIIGLAPMDGVTDASMRFITKKHGAPDVIFTEFVSAEGLAHLIHITPASLPPLNLSGGKWKLFRDLIYDESERPIVAQLFGGDPKAFYISAKKIVELGFDGVDINMGCPAKKVARRGEGAGLINNQSQAKEIIEAVKEGIRESRILNLESRIIPVSVKTRIGYEKPDESWWEFLAEQDLAVVSIHGRTFRQMYTGRADWEMIGKMASVIKSTGTLVLGNGDILSRAEAINKTKKYGLDGVLIGRNAIGNPWIFNITPQPPSLPAGRQVNLSGGVDRIERFKVMVEHCKKFEELFPEDKFFAMRKHLCWYAKGFDGAGELRKKLVLANSSKEVSVLI